MCVRPRKPKHFAVLAFVLMKRTAMSTATHVFHELLDTRDGVHHGVVGDHDALRQTCAEGFGIGIILPTLLCVYKVGPVQFREALYRTAGDDHPGHTSHCQKQPVITQDTLPTVKSSL